MNREIPSVRLPDEYFYRAHQSIHTVNLSDLARDTIPVLEEVEAGGADHSVIELI